MTIMDKNILYVAESREIGTGHRLSTAKIGVTKNFADQRIRQLNSTKMPIRVELVGAWTFGHSPVSASDAEKAAHFLLAPYIVNGEWFEDPIDDLADRVGKFAERLGARPAEDGDSEIVELNDRRAKEREKMEAVFEPVRSHLEDHQVNWEYMTWKVGMDSPYGRLNISVRSKGDLYLKMRCNKFTAEELTSRTNILWT